jgi:deazaflavin-dependent oxidoreductase (nitroreductase family)
MGGSFKRGWMRLAEKYIANPPTKALLHLRFPMPLCMLETTGRVSGKLRRVPVMDGRVGDELWIVAEHGHRAGYVRNIVANPKVRVKKGRGWTEGTAHVLDDDDPFARAEWVAEKLGRSKNIAVRTAKLISVDPVTVRVDLDYPTGRGDDRSPDAAPGN